MAGLPIIVLAEDKVLEVIEVKYDDPIKDLAYWEVVKKWGEAEWEAFNWIISRESNNWTVYTAHYPTGYTKDGIKSSAYGLGGFLDSTWQGVGCEKTDDGKTQVICTMKYVEQRYSTPTKAKLFHLANNWY